MEINSQIAAWIAVVLLTGTVVAVSTRLRAAKEPSPDLGELEQLRAELTAAHAAKRRAEGIVERMAEGVLVLDGSLRPLTVNPSARELLGLARVELPERLPATEILALARRALREGEGTEDDVELWFPERRTLHVRAVPLEDHDGVVVVLQDVTEALRTQRMRREFVAHASHELKTPVASLQALAEALPAATADDPETAARLAEHVRQESERLGRLIADLLDLSRLEDAGRIPDQEIDLARVTRREVDAVKAQAGAKGIEITLALPEHVRVRGDEQQLALVVRNLVDNALRYTPAAGRVAITLADSGGEVRLEVVDTGVGIPREAQARIFERFYRLDRARSRERGGTGLGLAIVKHGVELHRGRITLESELGRGSTFTVWLPSLEPRRAAG